MLRHSPCTGVGGRQEGAGDLRQPVGGRGASRELRRGGKGVLAHTVCFLRRYRNAFAWVLLAAWPALSGASGPEGNGVVAICDTADPQGSPLPTPGSHLQSWLEDAG